MPDEKEFDVLNIESSEEVLTAEEIDEAEPDEVTEEVPTEPEVITEPEVTNETADNTDPESDEIEDGIVNAINSLANQINGLVARLDALEARQAEIDAREAARAKKLTGFFAPSQDGRDLESDPLPRIERKYI